MVGARDMSVNQCQDLATTVVSSSSIALYGTSWWVSEIGSGSAAPMNAASSSLAPASSLKILKPTTAAIAVNSHQQKNENEIPIREYTSQGESVGCEVLTGLKIMWVDKNYRVSL